MHPQDGFFKDRTVYIGFRFARASLDNARRIEETQAPAAILWRTALRAEYGDAADARRALAEAQRALAEALQNGAPQDRVSQLLEALRRAMDNYLQALVQDAMRRAPETEEDTRERAELSHQDLQRATEDIERLSREGRKEEANAMLDQLANVLQNLEVRLAQGAESDSNQQPDQQQQSGQQDGLQQTMQRLSEAVGRQRELNDDTRQAAGQGEGPKQENGQGLAERQSQIRDGLDSARRQASRDGAEKGQALAEADRAMRQAEEALRRGAFADARAAQEEAMRNLRNGVSGLAAEMRRRQSSEPQGEGGMEGERDPLGRLRGGIGDSGETRIPTEMDRVRSREILDELRRRAQDPRRPQAEREYLQRLLDRFADS
jgi:chromosome segregation ATPase